MGNPFVHMELNTPDLAKAKAFYGEMFAWQFQDIDMGPHGTYSTFKPASGPGGGMMAMPDGFPGWMVYVGVENVQASTEQARSLGATILIKAQEVQDVGWFTVLQDPTGCTLALFQPK